MNERYKIISLIGEGAFSKVYLGKHRNKRENVAIKIESKNSPSEGIALLHECKIILYLANGNSLGSCKGVPIIRYYENSPETVYMVMDYYEENLVNMVKEKQLSLVDKYKIFRDTFNILSSIHSKYVVHRDIKPSNIMLRARGAAKYQVCLIDFGMAKVIVDEDGEHIPNRKINDLIGTPKYVSVFVHMRNEPSQRDDFISLGYVFLYMLNNGVLPWGGEYDETAKRENIICNKKKEWLEDMMLEKTKTEEEEILVSYLTNCYNMHFTDSYNYSLPSLPTKI